MNRAYCGLKLKIKNLDKRIGNLRLEVKANTRKKIFEKWTKSNHESNNRLTGTLPNEIEEMFEIGVKREKMIE